MHFDHCTAFHFRLVPANHRNRHIEFVRSEDNGIEAFDRLEVFSSLKLVGGESGELKTSTEITTSKV